MTDLNRKDYTRLSIVLRRFHPGAKYHSSCFKCTGCGNNITGPEGFINHQEQLYCHACYDKDVAEKCQKCNKVFARIIAMVCVWGRGGECVPLCIVVIVCVYVCVCVCVRVSVCVCERMRVRLGSLRCAW